MNNAYEEMHKSLAAEIAAEGMVLLKNNGCLPLDKETKSIALYGIGARQTVKGGTGSGDVNTRSFVSVEEGLESLGFEIITKKLTTVKNLKRSLLFMFFHETPAKVQTEKTKKEIIFFPIMKSATFHFFRKTIRSLSCF